MIIPRYYDNNNKTAQSQMDDGIRQRFRDRDKGLKVGEDDERVTFVIFVMGSSVTGA